MCIMKIFAVYLLIINMISLAAMGIDKRRALQKKWRIRERTLFLLAFIGGSIGILAGMYLFRHKTKHLIFVIGIPVIICLQIAVFFIFRAKFPGSSQAAKMAVSKQLKQIENLDAETINTFVGYESLVSDSGFSAESSEQSEAAALAFFKNFESRILSAEVEGDTAAVTVQIKNIDTAALAHDLALALTDERILLFDTETGPSPTDKDLFILLSETLSSGNYDIKETQAVFHLKKDKRKWEIIVDDTLQDELVSHFTTILRDPYLLSAEEVLTLYMDKFSSMDSHEWIKFLSAEDLFATFSPSYSEKIDQLYMKEVADCFDWSLDKIDTEGSKAAAQLSITSIDMPYIMGFYRESLLEYAATTQSITDSDTELSDESAKRLLEAIETHSRAGTFKAEVTLENNGSGWQLRINDDLINAFLGDLEGALEVINGEKNGEDS